MIEKYRIVEKIGAGGMGSVYLAEDLSLKRPVAIKILSRTDLPTERAKAKLISEARSAAALAHPGICTIYEVGEVAAGEERELPGGGRLLPGTPFIAMEFLRGRPLSERIDPTSPIDLAQVVEIATQIADALVEAHKHGVVHRDLKPQNLIIDEGGHAKILDFGIAKRLVTESATGVTIGETASVSTDQTLFGSIVGTVNYMSPEQALGRPVDARSDIFSFGAILYEMTSGFKPFQGETITATLAKILEAEPRPLEGLRADLPDEFVRIVSKCLQKDPAARYQETEELLSDLRGLSLAIATGTLRRTRRAGDGSRRTLAQKLRSRPALVVSSVVGIVATAAGILILTQTISPRPQEPPSYRRLTFTGTSSSAALSPDGQFLAYTEGVLEDGKLMVKDLRGGQELTIATGRIAVGQFSPSGSEILGIDLAVRSYQAFLIPRLGGPKRSIGREGWIPLAWSPDGKWIAGYITQDKSIRMVASDTGDTNSFRLRGDFAWILNADWSPRGDLLVVQVADLDSNQRFIVTSPDGGSQVMLPGSITGISPRFSHDGKYIYYLVGEDQSWTLVRIKIDTRTGNARGEPWIVMRGLQSGNSFAFNAGRNSILYEQSNYSSNLWLGDINASRGDTLRCSPLTSGKTVVSVPSFSPDSRSIAYSRADGERANIFVMPVSGGSPRQLTFGDSNYMCPAWSPDGRSVACVTYLSGAPHVCLIPAGGGPPRTFPETKMSWGYSLYWGFGEKLIYRNPGNINIVLLDTDSGEMTELIAPPDTTSMVGFPRYSPDGREIVFWWGRNIKGGENRSEVWVFSSDGASRRLLTTGDYWPIGWSRDGRQVYVNDFEAGADTRVSLVDAATGEITRTYVVPIPRFDPSNTAISQDERWLALVSREETSDIWMVTGFDPQVTKRPSAAR